MKVRAQCLRLALKHRESCRCGTQSRWGCDWTTAAPPKVAEYSNLGLWAAIPLGLPQRYPTSARKNPTRPRWAA